MPGMFKQFFTIAILAASSLGLIAAKPNIVLVMADDQRCNVATGTLPL